MVMMSASRTVQLPLPRYCCSKMNKAGGAAQSPGQQLQISVREWSSKLSRFLSKRRSGLYIAALLACASLLMFVNHLNRMSLQVEKFSEYECEKNNTLPEQRKTSVHQILPARPLPSTLFLDPPLPAGHICEKFAMPPPPADKKRTGPRPCPVCYLPVEEAINHYPPPGVFPELKLNELTYVNEENAGFGGFLTFETRKESHKIKESMKVHCGFAGGERPGVGSGFDIDERDLRDMDKCSGIVVSSAIFGNYDPMQQPKNISKFSRENVCFFMFVDEETEAAIPRDRQYSEERKVGLWRVVTVRNLPYKDARRTGKIPKMLAHRLFRNARFSLWIDGKLELVVDPYQILERFLWRSNDTYAISKHYKRFDVFEEAEANKVANKYHNASIDAQVQFYREQGFLPYTASKMPLVSDVPEGCVIIREHTPITNLFSCLWFNEVELFTSRDQISFGPVRDNVLRQVPWRINMFMDCQRRNFVVQGYHRDVLMLKEAQIRALPATSSTKNFPPKKTKRKDGRSQSTQY